MDGLTGQTLCLVKLCSLELCQAQSTHMGRCAITGGETQCPLLAALGRQQLSAGRLRQDAQYHLWWYICEHRENLGERP